MDPAVPLVVSQVNPDDAATHQGIVANPNCSTMQLVPVLMALRDAVGIERVVVDTYQSVSGTGGRAIAELEGQVRAHAAGEPLTASVYPHPIAFNALPEIDVFRDDGYTKEEWKIIVESRKILHLPELRISCTAVRIPVFTSHSEAVHVETRDPISPDRARELFAAVPGVDRPGRPGRPRLPPGDASRRSRRGLRRPGAPRSIDPRRSRARPVGRQRQPAQGCRDERRRDRGDPDRAWLDPSRRDASGRRERGVTDAGRGAALEAIAEEIRVCTRCRLHEQRAKTVPGEGSPDTEVVLVGEGPGRDENQAGRPFVGASGRLLTELIESVGWRRQDVFITNVVKCWPPGNRDPQPDEIAACAPYLHRQLEVLDPAVVVTAGKHSLGVFMPGERIGRVHGTARPADPETGARDALVFAMYHPAFALYDGSNRTTLETDIAGPADGPGVRPGASGGRDRAVGRGHGRHGADRPGRRAHDANRPRCRARDAGRRGRRARDREHGTSGHRAGHPSRATRHGTRRRAARRGDVRAPPRCRARRRPADPVLNAAIGPA